MGRKIFGLCLCFSNLEEKKKEEKRAKNFEKLRPNFFSSVFLKNFLKNGRERERGTKRREEE